MLFYVTIFWCNELTLFISHVYHNGRTHFLSFGFGSETEHLLKSLWYAFLYTNTCTVLFSAIFWSNVPTWFIPHLYLNDRTIFFFFGFGSETEHILKTLWYVFFIHIYMHYFISQHFGAMSSLGSSLMYIIMPELFLFLLDLAVKLSTCGKTYGKFFKHIHFHCFFKQYFGVMSSLGSSLMCIVVAELILFLLNVVVKLSRCWNWVWKWNWAHVEKFMVCFFTHVEGI